MKKVSAIFLALVMVIASAGSAFAASVPGSVYSDSLATGDDKPVAQIQQELDSAGVKDVKSTDWYAGSVTVIIEAGLLAPASDGTFKPDATMSSGEGVSAFAKVMGVASKTDTPEVAMQKAQEAGLIGGGIAPESDLSRMDTARMIATSLGLTPANPSSYPFSDGQDLSADDRGILTALYEAGIFRGYPGEDGKLTFSPSGTLTRAEIAILLDRLLGRT